MSSNEHHVALPPAIFGIGRNYAEHAAELNNAVPDRLLVFMKNPSSVIGDSVPIVIPSICHDPQPQVDYEGELAMIIGAPARDVSVRDAMSHIAGYAIANDVSARWWQKNGSGGQFVRGKSFDTFCPMGPMVKADAVADPQNLEIITRLNGAIVQQASTSTMIVGVREIVAELSRGMTLATGTVILTGTPAGVGAGQTPPRFLKHGDVITITITGLGTLENPVHDAAHPASS
ncbi:MAG: fumarylacetoacetate hydrolase family protein [Phycisphaerales bacterium]|nr:fumarylacetoacetate hydrolase family protein [Phycisphaerales bacterium]